MQPASVLNFDDELSVFARGAPTLTPAQNNVASELASGLAAAEVNVLRVAPGMGRTTILRSIHAQAGGAFLVARQFLNLLSKRAPNALEETFLQLLAETLNTTAILFVDDFHVLLEVARMNLMNPVMTALLDEAARTGKKLVFAVNGENESPAVSERAIVWQMDDFEPEDYAHIAEYYLGSAAARLDMAKVHRFAPSLTAHQIKNACLWLGIRYAAPTTNAFIDYFRSRKSSVDPDEADPVEWSDMKGVDDAIEEHDMNSRYYKAGDPLWHSKTSLRKRRFWVATLSIK